MTTRILIAGTGKMGTNIGLFFAKKGCAVSWLSRDAKRLESFETRIRKRLRRIEKDTPDQLSAGFPTFHLAGNPLPTEVDFLIECIEEDQPAKTALLQSLRHSLPKNAAILSNSSSILPTDIIPECVGLHFFYPVELTGLVEAIFPIVCPESRKSRILELLDESDLIRIQEDEATAFAINRLLLPIQAESFRFLIAGWEPKNVDKSSISELLPIGQLSLMDSVGLDTVYSAICNYTSRMHESIRDLYLPLKKGLKQLLDENRLGKKNNNGILTEPLFPLSVENSQCPLSASILFMNTCYHAIDHGLISKRDLDLVLESVFGSRLTLEQATEQYDHKILFTSLRKLHADTGLAYFQPALPLSDSRPDQILFL
ncbi:MAG: 3-hydroxyacyl-CoA dehydrogenase NAD-binding domain-containing protein [Pseudomonadota bacterium]